MGFKALLGYAWCGFGPLVRYVIYLLPCDEVVTRIIAVDPCMLYAEDSMWRPWVLGYMKIPVLRIGRQEASELRWLSHITDRLFQLLVSVKNGTLASWPKSCTGFHPRTTMVQRRFDQEMPGLPR